MQLLGRWLAGKIYDTKGWLDEISTHFPGTCHGSVQNRRLLEDVGPPTFSLLRPPPSGEAASPAPFTISCSTSLVTLVRLRTSASPPTLHLFKQQLEHNKQKDRPNPSPGISESQMVLSHVPCADGRHCQLRSYTTGDDGCWH